MKAKELKLLEASINEAIKLLYKDGYIVTEIDTDKDYMGPGPSRVKSVKIILATR
ncbi:MAG: hypothetical protein OEQ81_13365 [Flavobacteriaceae bacterium]|nr:hypothetical protein [Flavobacteriaceae bacterium]